MLTAPQEAGNHNSSTPTPSTTPTPTTATTIVPPTPASTATARKAPDHTPRQDIASPLVSRDSDAPNGATKPSATNIAQPAHSPSSNPGVDPLSQVRPSPALADMRRALRLWSNAILRVCRADNMSASSTSSYGPIPNPLSPGNLEPGASLLQSQMTIPSPSKQSRARAQT